MFGKLTRLGKTLQRKAICLQAGTKLKDCFLCHRMRNGSCEETWRLANINVSIVEFPHCPWYLVFTYRGTTWGLLHWLKCHSFPSWSWMKLQVYMRLLEALQTLSTCSRIPWTLLLLWHRLLTIIGEAKTPMDLGMAWLESSRKWELTLVSHLQDAREIIGLRGFPFSYCFLVSNKGQRRSSNILIAITIWLVTGLHQEPQQCVQFHSLSWAIDLHELDCNCSGLLCSSPLPLLFWNQSRQI